MRWVALVEGIDHVCCRYRLRAFASHFAAAGHVLDLCPIPKNWWHRLRVFAQLDRYDGVVLQRKLLLPWQVAWLRRHSRRLIYDLDDAVFLRDSYAKGGVDSRLRRWRFDYLLRQVDAVIAGNEFLARHTAACPTTIIPTCVDLSRYTTAHHVRQTPHLVWIGSQSTLRGLETIRPWLEATGTELPALQLKLVCDAFVGFSPLRVERCWWSEATEAAELAQADVGLSWLPDDSWSRGKCGLKVLQYMAAGLPVLANPVGVQKEMVSHGVTGFLVSTQREWREALRLLGDPALRSRMGQAGRDRVRRDFSIDVGAGLWLKLMAGEPRARAAA